MLNKAMLHLSGTVSSPRIKSPELHILMASLVSYGTARFELE